MRVAAGRIVNGNVELEVPGGAGRATVRAVLFEDFATVSPEQKQWLLAAMDSNEPVDARDAPEILEELIEEDSRM